MPLVRIALGSNLADRAAHLLAARDALAALPGSTATRCSHVYETDPVGPGRQGRYLNAVIELRTSLEPAALMWELLRIETDAGRVRREKWGPRTLDLDLLLYDDLVIDTGTLTVPHPHLHERAFVLQPLCDIDPNLTHPVSRRSVRQLLDALNEPPLTLYEMPVWSSSRT
ncbi:MAG: 2-amino-4-hydroxy-6-hydroxymethyldihydropteridine diphosphokinase [Phycisphaeraceae bacterium]